MDRSDADPTIVPPNIVGKVGSALWYISVCNDDRSPCVQYGKQLQVYFPVRIRRDCGPQDQPNKSFPRSFFRAPMTTKHNEALNTH